MIDFGFVHPFVLKCYAEDPDGAIYMYREIYMTQRTVEEHAAMIMNEVTEVKRIEWYDHFNKVTRVKKEIIWIEPMPTVILCDHDAEGRRTFEKATGLGTQPAIKNVYEGINAHKQRLKGNEDGPLFFLMADALVELDQSQRDKLLPVCTENEYASYVWKVSSDGRIQDEPVKRDDDGVDCDRYISEWKDLHGPARYLPEKMLLIWSRMIQVTIPILEW